MKWLLIIGALVLPCGSAFAQQLDVYFRVLTCIEGESCPKVDIVGEQAHFTKEDCERTARLIAKAMSLNGKRYGYRCVRSDYEPPKMPDGPVVRR